ncbi:MAG: hypothetical protein CBARDCOR_5843 [uncultured Caballeronia sp.]|nr:MAG: hypothetical protein CBARDCOR_5843 [uncultured Caballeronia sp.]
MNRAISLRLDALALSAAALSACSERPDEPVASTHDSAAEQIARGRYLAIGGRLRRLSHDYRRRTRLPAA